MYWLHVAGVHVRGNSRSTNKDIVACYGILHVHYCVHESSLPVYVLNVMNSTHNRTFCVLKICLNDVLPSKFGPPSCSQPKFLSVCLSFLTFFCMSRPAYRPPFRHPDSTLYDLSVTTKIV